MFKVGGGLKQQLLEGGIVEKRLRSTVLKWLNHSRSEICHWTRNVGFAATALTTRAHYLWSLKRQVCNKSRKDFPNYRQIHLSSKRSLCNSKVGSLYIDRLTQCLASSARQRETNNEIGWNIENSFTNHKQTKKL